MSALVVAGACLVDVATRRIWLVQRPSTKRTYPLHWESPGGKVEAGEDVEETVRRELAEELGISCLELGNIPGLCYPIVGRWTLTDDRGELIDYSMFLCTWWEGTPTPKEGQPGIGLFTFDEMSHLAVPAANLLALRSDVLRAALGVQVASP